MLKYLYICLVICYASGLFCQSEYDQVVKTVNQYILASSNSQAQVLDDFFHEKASFFLSDVNQTITIPSRREFIEQFVFESENLDTKQSEILQVDIVGNAASVKVEEYVEDINRLYTSFIHLQKINLQWKIMNLTINEESSNRQKERILFVVSNAHYHGDSDINTANHFFEIILPYDEFVKNGYQVDFVSPEGGQIPIGYLSYTYSTSEKYIYDFDFMNKLKHTMKPEDVDYNEYEAIFYCGGGAAMYGVPQNKAIQELAIHIYENKRGVISSICHGAAGLVNLQHKDGTYIIEGKKVNGFPDLFEDKSGAYYEHFPFSIEQRIEERGGTFVYSKDGWDDFSISDGRLVTGQDPTSSRSVASKVMAVLKSLSQ